MSATGSDKHSSKYQENSPSKKNWRYEQVASPLFDQNPISPADLIPPSASDLAHALRQERRANAAKYASEEAARGGHSLPSSSPLSSSPLVAGSRPGDGTLRGTDYQLPARHGHSSALPTAEEERAARLAQAIGSSRHGSKGVRYYDTDYDTEVVDSDLPPLPPGRLDPGHPPMSARPGSKEGVVLGKPPVGDSGHDLLDSEAANLELRSMTSGSAGVQAHTSSSAPTTTFTRSPQTATGGDPQEARFLQILNNASVGPADVVGDPSGRPTEQYPLTGNSRASSSSKNPPTNNDPELRASAAMRSGQHSARSSNRISTGGSESGQQPGRVAMNPFSSAGGSRTSSHQGGGNGLLASASPLYSGSPLSVSGREFQEGRTKPGSKDNQTQTSTANNSASVGVGVGGHASAAMRNSSDKMRHQQPTRASVNRLTGGGSLSARGAQDADLRFQPSVNPLPGGKKLSRAASSYLEKPVADRLFENKSLLSGGASTRGNTSGLPTGGPKKGGRASKGKGKAGSAASGGKKKAPGGEQQDNLPSGETSPIKGSGWNKFAPPERDNRSTRQPPDPGESYASDRTGSAAASKPEKRPPGPRNLAPRPMQSEVGREKLSRLFHDVDQRQHGGQQQSLAMRGRAMSEKVLPGAGLSFGGFHMAAYGQSPRPSTREQQQYPLQDRTLFPGGCGVSEALARAKLNPRDLENKYSPTKKLRTRKAGSTAEANLPSARLGTDSNPYLFARRVFEKVANKNSSSTSPNKQPVVCSGRASGSRATGASPMPPTLVHGYITGKGALPLGGAAPQAEQRPNSSGLLTAAGNSDLPHQASRMQQGGFLNASTMSVLDASKVSTVAMPKWAASPILVEKERASPSISGLEFSPPDVGGAVGGGSSGIGLSAAPQHLEGVGLFKNRIVPVDIPATVQRASDSTSPSKPPRFAQLERKKLEESATAPQPKRTSGGSKKCSDKKLDDDDGYTSPASTNPVPETGEDATAPVGNKTGSKRTSLAAGATTRASNQSKASRWDRLCYDTQELKKARLKAKYPEKFLSPDDQAELELRRIEEEKQRRKIEQQKNREQLARVMQSGPGVPATQMYEYQSQYSSPGLLADSGEADSREWSTSGHGGRGPVSGVDNNEGSDEQLRDNTESQHLVYPSGGNQNERFSSASGSRQFLSYTRADAENSRDLYDYVPSKLGCATNPGYYMEKMQVLEQVKEYKMLEAQRVRMETEMADCTFDPFAKRKQGAGLIHRSVYEKLPRRSCLAADL
mmetsp:Transcript_3203/g.7546  ORF Transcript_3203/g.7546 Transcript_3203/m.7546 type:complete len:1257 (-) Transcript_3203:324-4094(-)|eukprot:CAMPEP_0178987974 /NCGR_PEP_ID=MMETSP0795-20121207/3563_1 /TAXON_ID=88552 /ORGANISM="Amoebophrya sp., Strain Ameob2" /LENGTH=1256 /DNA_ID=CAMNT_0020679217 /DNA_START=176 /DNA_END=3946 /DNA_ORIENTATION=+